MSAAAYGFSGWDIVDRAYGRYADDGAVAEISANVASRALLVEMERPPWYRQIDAERKALAKELAA